MHNIYIIASLSEIIIQVTFISWFLEITKNVPRILTMSVIMSCRMMPLILKPSNCANQGQWGWKI